MVVVSINADPIKYDLKSWPGAWVKLRPMSYGAKQHRKELAIADTRMRQVRGTGAQAQEVAMNLMQRIVSEFEFRECIAEHNLEVAEGKPFDFKDPASLDLLPSPVGEEIDKYISQMNNFEDEEDEDPKTV